jgi:hypothetical protein
VPTAQLEPAPGAARSRLAPQARIEELEYELSLARELSRRTDQERRRLDAHLAAAEAERVHLRAVLAQREAYVAAIHGSLVWKVAQSLRRLVGRAW